MELGEFFHSSPPSAFSQLTSCSWLAQWDPQAPGTTPAAAKKPKGARPGGTARAGAELPRDVTRLLPRGPPPPSESAGRPRRSIRALPDAVGRR